MGVSRHERKFEPAAVTALRAAEIGSREQSPAPRFHAERTQICEPAQLGTFESANRQPGRPGGIVPRPSQHMMEQMMKRLAVTAFAGVVLAGVSTVAVAQAQPAIDCSLSANA